MRAGHGAWGIGQRKEQVTFIYAHLLTQLVEWAVPTLLIIVWLRADSGVILAYYY